MGDGRWDAGTYTSRVKAAAAAGRPAFDYSHTTTTTTPRHSWKTHADLDPLGVTMRESRDSADHPHSTPIVVLFDHTGSMGNIPIELQKELPQLLGLLVRKSYIVDPQISFGAFGDENYDPCSLQISQFESDNRLDQHLTNILIARGGGGGIQESSQNALYFIARHMVSDAWEKRRAKGYVFLITDEQGYPTIRRDEVAKLIGDTLQEDLELATIVEEIKQRWNLFSILPKHSAGSSYPEVFPFWQEMLGQNALQVEDAAGVCALIGLTIGVCEGTTDLVKGTTDLRDFGASDRAIAAASRALKDHPGAVAIVGGSGGLPGLGDTDGPARADRLDH